MRAYLEFVAAVLYFFVARSFAFRFAVGLAGDAWVPLVQQAFLFLLLVCGYAAFGALFDRQVNSISAQGLPLRSGWYGEAALGLAVGWAVVVLCVVPMTLIGGIATVITTERTAWGWFLADAAFFAFTALAEEVAFRGYGFQRFEQVVGPYGAAIGFALFYAIVQALAPGSNRVSVVVSIIFSLLLSIAYLRTRALWVSWGLNFGWKASRALIFGLTVAGVNSHSSVVEGNPMGPFWITGGGYGLDGSWIAAACLVLAFPLVYRITRNLDFRHNAPVIVPGGMPVDLEAAARKQHETAMGPDGAAAQSSPSLVQIFPAPTSPPQAYTASESSTGPANEQ
jgi:membrane protease YdiL (CAAX protease family)